MSPKQSKKFTYGKTKIPEIISPKDLKYDVMSIKWNEILDEKVVDHLFGKKYTVELIALFHSKAVNNIVDTFIMVGEEVAEIRKSNDTDTSPIMLAKINFPSQMKLVKAFIVSPEVAFY